jgi:cyclase
MLRPRVIPCLLIHEGGLVKTVAFRNPKYVGDPINAVKIFNEKESDELVVLDIDATVRGKEPDYQTIAHLAAECRMPLAYGGGVRSAEQAKRIISLGVEKVCVSAAAIERPTLVSEIAEAVGSQSVAVVVDAKKKLLGGWEVCTHNGRRSTGRSPLDVAREAEAHGAGEIIVNSIDRDGEMKGYDLALAAKVRDAVHVPLTILGGAGSLADIGQVITLCGTVGAAAGSLFVFKGAYRAVLINYPQQAQKEELVLGALRARD